MVTPSSIAGGRLSTADDPRGFLIADALTGLIILTTLAALLFTAVGRQRHASQSLADTRAMMHLAESAAMALGRGEPSQLPSDVQLRVVSLPSAAIAAHHWAQLTLTRGHRTATLTALVADAPAGATQPGATRP
jgi:hypothetical protein